MVCLTFVIHRGYKCIGKFLAAPVTGVTKNHFSGGLEFPTISSSSNKGAFKEEVLNVCNLTRYEYGPGNFWTGNGNESFCFDPKKLYKKARWHPRELISFRMEI